MAADVINSSFKASRYYLLLLLVAFLAVYPVITLHHPLKWDLIDQAYPWKYLIGECLREGILPLWNPYQLLGSPIHADPQSSAWYPVTWFFGYFFSYTIYTISIDFFLHIFLAGAGMFYLGRKLYFRNETAFFMAVAYMLSGFFIGNAQHFMWIISATWIPFILGSFLELKENPSLVSATRIGLFSFMILTGGYPAFVFLLIYLLMAMFILFIIEFYRGRDIRRLYRFIGFTAIAVVVTILMSSVVLISVYHLQGAMTRGAGVTLQQALFGAFTVKSFISFLLPYASVRNAGFFGTDLSMTNAYFGLITLVFFLSSLQIKKNKLINLFLAWGIFCLLAASGDATPVRKLLYQFVPFMDQFRFPALFRIYVILSFVILAGYGFDTWLKGDVKIRKWLKINTLLVAIGIAAFMVMALTRGNLNMKEFLKEDLFIFSEKSRISQHILFQGIFQLILAGLFLLMIIRGKSMKQSIPAVLLMVCLDMAGAARLNGPYTVYYHQFASEEIYNHARGFPAGFPLPGKEKIIDNTDQGKLTYQALWRNLNIFQKQVSWQGYNPLHLKGFEELADNHPRLLETILQNPLVYQSDRVQSLDILRAEEGKGNSDPARIYLNDPDYQRLQGAGLKLSSGDGIQLTGFSPVEVRARSTSQHTVMVTLLQNNYYGWKAAIDGKPAEVMTGNIAFITVLAGPGNHEIIFSFDPVGIRVGFYISLIMVIGGLVVMRRTVQGL